MKPGIHRIAVPALLAAAPGLAWATTYLSVLGDMTEKPG